MDKQQKKELKVFATNIRIETIKALGHLGFGHVGGAFSIADTIAVLYGGMMKIDPKNPKWADRDYLVCSKGHAGPIIYSTLAMKGYFPKEELLTINKPHTHLPSHCDRNLTTGIDMTTGSLGQGSSLAVGIAAGNKLDKRDNYTYLIMGDGEIQEGQVWEAAGYAAQQKLDHLIAFVDWNKRQLDGTLEEINDYSNISERFEVFGWHAVTVDGHDVEAVWNAIEEAKKVKDKPSCIVLDTVKAKGCSFAEDTANCHHITINEEQLKEALTALEAQLAKEMAE